MDYSAFQVGRRVRVHNPFMKEIHGRTGEITRVFRWPESDRPQLKVRLGGADVTVFPDEVVLLDEPGGRGS